MKPILRVATFAAVTTIGIALLGERERSAFEVGSSPLEMEADASSYAARFSQSEGDLREAEVALAGEIHASEYSSAPAYTGHGRILERRGDEVGAALRYYDAIQIGGDPHGYARLGQLVLEKGHPDLAEEILGEGLLLHPENDELAFWLAKAQVESAGSEHDSAALTIRALESSNPSEGDPWMERVREQWESPTNP